MKTRTLDERALSFLGWSQNFTILGLAQKLKEPVAEVHASVMRLVAEGLVHKVEGSRYDSYHAVVEPKPEPESTRYVPPFKELRGYDLGRLQRSCEGARNSVTGVV